MKASSPRTKILQNFASGALQPESDSAVHRKLRTASLRADAIRNTSDREEEYDRFAMNLDEERAKIEPQRRCSATAASEPDGGNNEAATAAAPAATSVAAPTLVQQFDIFEAGGHRTRRHARVERELGAQLVRIGLHGGSGGGGAPVPPPVTDKGRRRRLVQWRKCSSSTAAPQSTSPRVPPTPPPAATEDATAETILETAKDKRRDGVSRMLSTGGSTREGGRRMSTDESGHDIYGHSSHELLCARAATLAALADTAAETSETPEALRRATHMAQEAVRLAQSARRSRRAEEGRTRLPPIWPASMIANTEIVSSKRMSF